MKKLRYMRHLPYDKSTGRVLSTSFNRIAESSWPEFTDIFFGPLHRTLQTAFAVVVAMKNQPKIHSVTKEIGSSSEINSALTFLQHCVAPPDFQFCRFYVRNLKKIFDLIPDNAHGLAIGHGPIIEITTRCFGTKTDPLPPLGYIDFSQSTDERIKVFNQ